MIPYRFCRLLSIRIDNGVVLRDEIPLALGKRAKAFWKIFGVRPNPNNGLYADDVESVLTKMNEYRPLKG